MNDVTDARVGIILIVAKEYKDGVASGSELPGYADSILMVRAGLKLTMIRGREIPLASVA
jgi:hypothetical protein